MSQHVVLAVDCSTTGSKAVAFDADGRTVVEARRSYARRSPQPGWQEQDAADWWEATADALAEVVAKLGTATRPVALGLTHQRETFVCLDEHGAEVRPAILWLDTRAGEQIRRLGSNEIHQASGKPPSTTPSLYKLAWIAEHEPDALARTALVLDVHGYLVRQLTGENATSWAAADPLSLVDMASFEWSASLVATAGLTVDRLPRLVAPGSIIGGVADAAAARTGLAAGLPVVAGAGDGQCAGLGAGVLTADHAYLNLGTGLTMGVHSAPYRFDLAYRTLASPIAGAYTLEALLSSGALSIAWFRDMVSGLTGDGREKRMEEMAMSVPPGSHGVLFLPYLTSAETPYWDADARGAYVGLSDQHGRAEMYRAVLEGLAFEERLSLTRIEESTGQRVERVTALGGASQSPLFTQLLADVLERPVAISAEVETTALGAAILAAAAVGLDGMDDVDDAVGRMTHVEVVRQPDLAPRALYREAAEVYAEIYPRLRDLFPRIAQLRCGGSL
ncbi:FGGY family carbohydrate kinase [Actinopolymorpha sp. B9G3]|uniref:xylulokinase n=1 Tax=Actinopolymorpha sp. B9G3 TaxID=3158970 RepID=UPI0032D93525